VFAGYALGLASGNLLTGRPLLSSTNNLPGATVGFLLMSLALGAFGAYYFTSREMLAKARLEQEEAQRQASEARLRLTRFARMLPQLLSQKQLPLVRADLRYTNGFALTWADPKAPPQGATPPPAPAGGRSTEGST